LLAPLVFLSIFMRGLLRLLLTRVYFPGEPANDEDPVLQSVPESRRETLVANADGKALTWSVRLQGDGETVFFEY
jgi:protocatechuate 3,4-dioxygenase alpha subunit